MRKILFLVAVTAFVGFASAQQKVASSSKIEKVQNNFDAWGEELELSADQKAKIQTINEASAKEREALRSSGTAADFMEINNRRLKAIEAVLTPNQIRKMNEVEQRKNQEKLEAGTR